MTSPPEPAVTQRESGVNASVRVNDVAPLSTEAVKAEKEGKKEAEGEAKVVAVTVIDLDPLKSPDAHAKVKAKTREKDASASSVVNDVVMPMNTQAGAGDETTEPSSKPFGNFINDDAEPSNSVSPDSIRFFRLNRGYEEASAGELLIEPVMNAFWTFIPSDYLGGSQARCIPLEHFLESLVRLQSMVRFSHSIRKLSLLFFFCRKNKILRLLFGRQQLVDMIALFDQHKEFC